MAKREKPKPDSKPQTAAPSSVQPAANVVDQQGSTTTPGPDGPGNDAPPALKPETEAPETTAGASATSGAVEGNEPPPGELLTIAFPLPAGIPSHVLEGAVVIVRAKPARGRWRAGRQFSREETLIPFANLRDFEIKALAGDTELIVSLRVLKPG